MKRSWVQFPAAALTKTPDTAPLARSAGGGYNTLRPCPGLVAVTVNYLNPGPQAAASETLAKMNLRRNDG